MSKIAAYEAPAATDLGSVQDLTMTFKNKKLAFSIDFVEKKKFIHIIIPGTTDR